MLEQRIAASWTAFTQVWAAWLVVAALVGLASTRTRRTPTVVRLEETGLYLDDRFHSFKDIDAIELGKQVIQISVQGGNQERIPFEAVEAPMATTLIECTLASLPNEVQDRTEERARLAHLNRAQESP